MSDTLYAGNRFRTFNVIDDFNRECLAVEIDTSITGKRLIRRYYGPEFLSGDFVAWAESAGMIIQYIQPGEPNQNAYIERFNRTYREEVLSLYLFRNLNEVRETTYWWRNDYNELRPHDSLDDMTPSEFMGKYTGNSTLKLST